MFHQLRRSALLCGIKFLTKKFWRNVEIFAFSLRRRADRRWTIRTVKRHLRLLDLIQKRVNREKSRCSSTRSRSSLVNGLRLRLENQFGMWRRNTITNLQIFSFDEFVFLRPSIAPIWFVQIITNDLYWRNDWLFAASQTSLDIDPFVHIYYFCSSFLSQLSKKDRRKLLFFVVKIIQGKKQSIMTAMKWVEQQNTKRQQRRGKQCGRSQQRAKLGTDFVRRIFDEICLRRECFQSDQILPAPVLVRRVILLQWLSPVCPPCHLHLQRLSLPFVSGNIFGKM